MPACINPRIQTGCNIGETPRRQVVRKAFDLPSPREREALLNDPEASWFHDPVGRRLIACRGSLDKHTLQIPWGIHRECSLRRCAFGVSQSYLVVTAGRLTSVFVDSQPDASGAITPPVCGMSRRTWACHGVSASSTGSNPVAVAVTTCKSNKNCKTSTDTTVESTAAKRPLPHDRHWDGRLPTDPLGHAP